LLYSAKVLRIISIYRSPLKNLTHFRIRNDKDWAGTDIKKTNLEQETESLRQAWQLYEYFQLQDYLVQDVQDPRINIQSILSRHFLIDRIFDTSDELLHLMEH